MVSVLIDPVDEFRERLSMNEDDDEGTALRDVFDKNNELDESIASTHPAALMWPKTRRSLCWQLHHAIA